MIKKNIFPAWGIACLVLSAFSPLMARALDSYDAALDKVKAMQAKADPVKQKNRTKNLVNLKLRLEALKNSPTKARNIPPNRSQRRCRSRWTTM